MEQEYKFQNRYGDPIVLTKVRDNIYKLSCKDDEYIRFGLYNYENEGYYFVDPPGGPFMKVGTYKLDGKVLSKIEMEDKNIILTFCNSNTLYNEAAAELNRIITEIILKYAKEYLIDMTSINYRMSTTRDSLDKGEWLPDTDACFEILKDGETIGFNG